MRRRSDPDHAVPFAGQWVVPGGRVDDVDRTGEGDGAQEVARRAAVRELAEEVGIVVGGDDLRSLWELESGIPSGLRFRISYFETWLPPGQAARPDGVELDEYRWIRPSVAVAQGRSGRLDVPPATLETLRRLATQGPSPDGGGT